MQIRPIHVAAVFLLLAGGVLAYSVVTSSINPYLTVSQAISDPANQGKEVQILADLSSYSVDDAGNLHLTIMDGTASMEVAYSGIPPQSLQKGQKIVAIGMLSSAHHLNATRILTKCPSKYE